MNITKPQNYTVPVAPASTTVYLCLDTGEDILPQDLLFFPASVQERIGRYKHPEARRESLLAYLLLRRALAERGKDCLLAAMKTAPSGKPYIKGFPFSLSHCKGASVCCVSGEEIGADIEAVRVFKKDFAASLFDVNPMDIFIRLDEKARNSVLTRQWTQIESYLKLTGEGIRTKRNRLSLEERDTDILLCGSHIQSIFIEDKFWLSLASYQKSSAAELKILKANQLFAEINRVF